MLGTFLKRENLTFSNHLAVTSKFGEYFVNTKQVLVEFHRYLIQAQQSRTRADHAASFQVTETEATTQVERAEILLVFSESNQYFSIRCESSRKVPEVYNHYDIEKWH